MSLNNNPFLRPNSSQTSQSSIQSTTNNFFKNVPTQSINTNSVSNSFFSKQNTTNTNTNETNPKSLISSNPFYNNPSSITSIVQPISQISTSQPTLNNFFPKAVSSSTTTTNSFTNPSSNMTIGSSGPPIQSSDTNNYSKYASNSFPSNNNNFNSSTNNFFSTTNKWNTKLQSINEVEEYDLTSAQLYKQNIKIVDVVQNQAETFPSNNICLLPNFMEFSIEELRAFNNWKKRKKFLEQKSIIRFQKLTNDSKLFLFKSDKNVKINFSEKDLKVLEKWANDFQMGRSDNFLEFLLKQNINTTIQVTDSNNPTNCSSLQSFNPISSSNNFDNKQGTAPSSSGTTWGSAPNIGQQNQNSNTTWYNNNSTMSNSNLSNTPSFNNSGQVNLNNNFQSITKSEINPYISNSTSNPSPINQIQWGKPPQEETNQFTRNSTVSNTVPINNTNFFNGNTNNNSSLSFKNNCLPSTNSSNSNLIAFGQSGSSSMSTCTNNTFNNFPSNKPQNEYTTSASFFHNNTNNNNSNSNDFPYYRQQQQPTGNNNSTQGLNINSINTLQSSYLNNNNFQQEMSHNYLQPNIVNNFVISNTTPMSEQITKYQVDWEKNDLNTITSKPSLKDQINEIKQKNNFNYKEVEQENKYFKIYQQNFVPLRYYKRDDKIRPEKEVKSSDRDPELFLKNLIKDQELIQSQKQLTMTSLNDKMKNAAKNESLNNKNMCSLNDNCILSKNFSSKNNRISSQNEVEKDFKIQVVNKNLIPVKISSNSPVCFYFIIETKKSHSLTEFKTVIAKHLEKKKLFNNIRIDSSDFILHLENNIVLDQINLNFEDLLRKYFNQLYKLGLNYVLNLNLIFTVKFLDKYDQKNDAFSKIFHEDELEIIDNDENNPRRCNNINNKDNFIPILTKNYKTKPDNENIKKMDKNQLENIKNFEISNEFGKIKFIDPVDISFVNLDNIYLEKGQIFIDKIDTDMKKLNKRGILELYGINDLGNIDNDKGFTEFVKILSQRCKEIGVNKFVI